MLSTLSGAQMRIGQHGCYERFVFEMQGTGGFPGWRVGYRNPILADPSGEPVQLAGGADLEVVVGVWTVPGSPTPADGLPFRGPQQLSGPAGSVLREARLIGSFEGISQFGLGIDKQRPFRVTVLQGPPRLVVDISTTG